MGPDRLAGESLHACSMPVVRVFVKGIHKIGLGVARWTDRGREAIGRWPFKGNSRGRLTRDGS